MKKLVLLLVLSALPLTSRGVSTINNTNAFAYGGNIGWLNWHGSDVGQPPGPYSVTVGEFICQGWIYGANVGWISLCRKDPNTLADIGPNNNIQYSQTAIGGPSGPVDYGVNYTTDPSTPGVAYLRGFAYGANIGWINFDSPTNAFPGSIPAGMKPQLSLFTGKMHGYAWSETCGWISLDEFENPLTGNPMIEHYVQTDHIAMGTDSNSNGIADAWEYLYFGGLLTPGGQNSLSPNGNGMTLQQDYTDGVNPNTPDSRLSIIAYSTTKPGGVTSSVTFTSTTARLYSIEVNADVTQPLNWTDSGLGMFAPDTGTSTTRPVIQASAIKRFYRAKTMRPLP